MRHADGSFVVVWRGAGDGGRTGIFVQRYDDMGALLGTEFTVSGEDLAMRNLSSELPAVARKPNGEFVVVWRGIPSAMPLADFPQVVGRRVDSAGVAIGDEFEVSIATPGGYYGAAPDLTTMDDGRYTATDALIVLKIAVGLEPRRNDCNVL